MGRRARVHPAAGSVVGFRHEEVHILDPAPQVCGAAVHQVRGERYRRRDERQRRQCRGGSCQGVKRPRKVRALQRGIQQPVPVAYSAAADGSPAVQGLESQ